MPATLSTRPPANRDASDRSAPGQRASSAPRAARGNNPDRPQASPTPQRAMQSSSPPSNKPSGAPKPEPKILFQSFFKSVGPRTYAAQVKEAGNGNQFLVLTEGKRDDKTGEVRKTRLFVFSEDFPDFFRMVKEAAEWIKANPVSDEVKRKRERFWEKKNSNHQDTKSTKRLSVDPRSSPDPQSERR